LAAQDVQDYVGRLYFLFEHPQGGNAAMGEILLVANPKVGSRHHPR
jgi:hypothetical protein